MIEKIKQRFLLKTKELTGDDYKKIVLYSFILITIIPLFVGCLVAILNNQGSNIFRMWWLAFSSNGIKATLILEILGAVAMAIIILLRSDGKERDEKGRIIADVATYGDAHFQTKEELCKNYTVSDQDGTNRFIYGSIDPENKLLVSQYKRKGKEKVDNNNIMMVAAAGSGKTVAVNIPLILELASAGENKFATNELERHGENMFITDPKGELYAYLHKFLEKRGYDVYTFITKEDMMEATDCFNPLDFVNMDQSKAQSIATYILDLSGERADFWTNGELALFIALTMYFTNKELEHEEGVANIPYMYHYLASTPEDTIATALKSIPVGVPGYDPAHVFINAEPVLQTSWKSGLVTKLNLYSSKKCATLLSQTDFEPMDFFHNKAVVFCIMDGNNPTFAPLLRCFFQIFTEAICGIADNNKGDPNMGEEQQKIYPAYNIILEETNNIGKIETLENILSTVRGRNMNTVLTFQNYDQLFDTYQNKRESIMSACHTQMFFGANDDSSAEYVSKILGKKTVVTELTSRNVSNYKPVDIILNEQERVSEVEAPLLTADQVRVETRDKVIIRTFGRNPMMLYPFSFWNHKDAVDIEYELVNMRLPRRYRTKDYYDKLNLPWKDPNEHLKRKEELRKMLKPENIIDYYENTLGIKIERNSGIPIERVEVPRNPEAVNLDNFKGNHSDMPNIPKKKAIPKSSSQRSRNVNPDATNQQPDVGEEPKKQAGGPPRKSEANNAGQAKPADSSNSPIVSTPKQLGNNQK